LKWHSLASNWWTASDARFVYSHRIYGEKIGDQMSAWLKNNGAEKEKALMEWNEIPSPASLNKASGQ
jgi:hypothetical protein